MKTVKSFHRKVNNISEIPANYVSGSEISQKMGALDRSFLNSLILNKKIASFQLRGEEAERGSVFVDPNSITGLRDPRIAHFRERLLAVASRRPLPERNDALYKNNGKPRLGTTRKKVHAKPATVEALHSAASASEMGSKLIDATVDALPAVRPASGADRLINAIETMVALQKETITHLAKLQQAWS